MALPFPHVAVSLLDAAPPRATAPWVEAYYTLAALVGRRDDQLLTAPRGSQPVRAGMLLVVVTSAIRDRTDSILEGSR